MNIEINGTRVKKTDSCHKWNFYLLFLLINTPPERSALAEEEFSSLEAPVFSFAFLDDFKATGRIQARNPVFFVRLFEEEPGKWRLKMDQFRRWLEKGKNDPLPEYYGTGRQVPPLCS